MDKPATATMNLPMDLIAPAIEAHLNAAVVEALKGSDALIVKLVQEILQVKVNSEGKVSGSTHYDKTPWITWAVHDIVRAQVKESISIHLASYKEKIAKAIDAEMKRSNSRLVRSFVECSTEGLAKALSDNYRMKVTFEEH